MYELLAKQSNLLRHQDSVHEAQARASVTDYLAFPKIWYPHAKYPRIFGILLGKVEPPCHQDIWHRSSGCLQGNLATS